VEVWKSAWVQLMELPTQLLAQMIKVTTQMRKVTLVADVVADVVPVVVAAVVVAFGGRFVCTGQVREVCTFNMHLDKRSNA